MIQVSDISQRRFITSQKVIIYTFRYSRVSFFALITLIPLETNFLNDEANFRTVNWTIKSHDAQVFAIVVFLIIFHFYRQNITSFCSSRFIFCYVTSRQNKYQLLKFIYQ